MSASAGTTVGLRMFDLLLLDPNRYTLWIRRKETANGLKDAPPPLFPDGRAEAPFCSCVHVDDVEKLTLLAKEAIGAFVDMTPVVFTNRIDGCIAFELVMRRPSISQPIQRSGEEASLLLLAQDAPTTPRHWDVLAFHPSGRQICFVREGRKLCFSEGRTERTVFSIAGATFSDGSLAVTLQEAARALLGLIPKPILGEPVPTALEGWRCFRLLAPTTPAAPAVAQLPPTAPERSAPTAPVVRRPARRR